MATKKVKETVETVKSEAIDAAKKLSKKAEPAIDAAKNTIKTVTEKAEPAVRKARAATGAAVAAGKKAAAALTQEVFVEYSGIKYDCSNVVERCKEDFKAKHNAERVRSCRIYIKPEDGMVYYVINELADKIVL